jgi:hypothetical protein
MAGSRNPGVLGGPEGLVGGEHHGRDGQREVKNMIQETCTGTANKIIDGYMKHLKF